MDLQINAKTVFLAGGSKGIGRDVALLLAEEGCKVGVIARTVADIDATVNDIVKRGGEAIGIQADITTREGIHHALAQLRNHYGDPQIVVGQAKHNVPGDFADITDSQHYFDAFNAYTISQIELLHAVLPAMKAAGWGRFIHIGSATAKEPQGYIHHAIANTTRPSTIGMLKTVADEVAAYGITVNTVAPGWVATPNACAYIEKNVGLNTAEERQAWMKEVAGVPAARMGESVEVASLVAYLCSEMAGYINGKWIEVDGGQHRAMF